MEENEVLDPDAMLAEWASAEPLPTEPEPTVDAAPPERNGAEETTETGVPPSSDAKDSDDAKPEQSEESELAQMRAELAKLRNDTVLAQKAQAAADKKVAELQRVRDAAIVEAQRLELQTIHEARQNGTLTQEQIDAGPTRISNWVQRKEQEAIQAEAEGARIQAQTQVEVQRAEHEARIEFKEQALSLLPDRQDLGLSAKDVDVEKLLEKHLADPDRKADIALTWKLGSDPAEQARIAAKVWSGALKDAKAELAAIAAAKQTTAEKKASRTTYDRSTAAGPATGGRDPLPTFTSVEDDLRNYYEQTGG